MNAIRIATVLGAVSLIASFLPADAGAQMSTPISLSDSLGTTIDAEERAAYHLFPEIKGFTWGQVVRLQSGEYRIQYKDSASGGEILLSKAITSKAVDELRVHAMFDEKYFRLRDSLYSGTSPESHALYLLALRYASEGSYDRTLEFFNELNRNYPASSEAAEAHDLYPKADALRKARRTQFKIDPIDRSGRTDILVFSGYYGLWLGIATPIALRSENATAYGAGMLIAGPAAVLAAHYITKTRGINDASATMVALGGNWGIWQGLGWYLNGTESGNGNDAIGAGELAGLGGIALGVVLATNIDFTPGGAELISSGASWGTWFGLVAGSLMGDVGHNPELTGSLLGSDALAVGTGILAWESSWSTKRVRLTNLAGVLGTIGGFGIDAIAQPSGDKTVLAIAGAGSIAGLAVGTLLTRNMDNAGNVSLSGGSGYDSRPLGPLHSRQGKWSISPAVEIARDSKRSTVPCIGFQVSF
jgi:hypothetical protein